MFEVGTVEGDAVDFCEALTEAPCQTHLVLEDRTDAAPTRDLEGDGRPRVMSSQLRPPFADRQTP